MVFTGMVWFQELRNVSLTKSMVRRAGVFASALLLASCTGPERLTEADVTLEQASAVVQERMIAPKTEAEKLEFELPQRQPRRTILQVLHHPTSLANPDFINLLQQQISEEIRFREAQASPEDNLEDGLAPQPELKPMSDEDRQALVKSRGDERLKLMFDRGAALEDKLYDTLAVLQTREETLAKEVIPGLSETLPDVFGKNLTRDPDGYLSMPADIVFIGGRASNMPSKTALLDNYVDDKMITLAVRDMPLADVIRLITGALNIQGSLSNDILSSDIRVGVQMRASALSILDAVLTQHDLAILFDPDVEIARFYRDNELDSQLGQIRQAIIAYNQLLFKRKQLQEARFDLGAVRSMLVLVQGLMRGDSDGFLSGVDGFERAGLGAEAIGALRSLSNESFALRPWLAQFDSETNMLLAQDQNADNSAEGKRLASVQSRFNDILVEDPCVIPGQEVFVEKIAVYNKESTASLEYLNNYFSTFQTQTTAELAASSADSDAAEMPAEAEATATDGGEAADAGTAATTATAAPAPVVTTPTISIDLPDGCNTSPSLRPVSLQADSTGIIIQGTRVQNSIAMRLVTEDDAPQMQVLVEIFMVTVSRDFSRRLENLLRATDTPGGSGVTEADLLTNISSAITGGYSVNLSAPTGEITSALNFLETNQLGRIVSSPTILVNGDGGTAEITREQVAEVLFLSEVVNPDNTTSVEDRNTALEAPLTLRLSEVQVLPANNNVKMNVYIENKRFLRNIGTIARQVDADYTRDIINTAFTASPGDVIVLAGLTANSDSTNTTGLPGTTTGALAPLAGLLAGQDVVSNSLNEMVIFLAPTVFDPSSDKQPHAPFK